MQWVRTAPREMSELEGNSSCRILVIIPAYNEQAGLPLALEDLRRNCPNFDVLVVDDGSKDGTAEVARSASVPVARLPINLGIGGALRTGFRYAIRHGYDQAVQFDADGQHNAADIGSLLEALRQGADMAVGTRFSHSSVKYSLGRVRWGAMRVLRLAVRLLSGRSFSDTSSGFRAFRRPVLEYFADVYPVEYMDSVEALLLACYAGFHVVDVPCQMRERSTGVPSTRNVGLVYHYLRLVIVMLTSASRHGRPPQGHLT